MKLFTHKGFSIGLQISSLLLLFSASSLDPGEKPEENVQFHPIMGSKLDSLSKPSVSPIIVHNQNDMDLSAVFVLVKN